jgi:hypothetical protein
MRFVKAKFEVLIFFREFYMIKTPAPKNSNSKRNVNRKEVTPLQNPEKRDNIFSQSRDIREDRGLRQVKTEHSSETMSHEG